MLDQGSPTLVLLACESLRCGEGKEENSFKLAYIVYNRAHDKVFELHRRKYDPKSVQFPFARLIRNSRTQKNKIRHTIPVPVITSLYIEYRSQYHPVYIFQSYVSLADAGELGKDHKTQ